MAASIKRIEKLKNRSRKLVEKFDSIKPLSFLTPDYVASSGLTCSDIQDKINSLRNCANVIELRERMFGDEKDFTRGMTIAAANFCKQHVICPVCADRMQSRRRVRYNDPIKKQAEMVADGSRFAYMVTYTVTDGNSLSERIEALKAGKRAFRLMGQKRSGYYSRGESSAIRAGVSTIEIKRGSGSGSWHVHSHDLIFTSRPLDYQIYDSEKKKKLHEKYGKRIPDIELLKAAIHTEIFKGKNIPVSKISSEWLQATDGDSINISVSPVRQIPKECTGKKRRMYRSMSFSDSVAYQAKEVLKYPLKPSENNITDLLEILNDTFNRRMVEAIGDFRGCIVDDYNDPPENEIENYVMIWNENRYKEAIPGGIRTVDISEEATKTRKKAGILLGNYRRYRRSIIDSIPQHPGENIAKILDLAKEVFRRNYNLIWSVYRSKRAEIDRRQETSIHSPVLSLSGFYVPCSTSKDIYSAAFS